MWFARVAILPLLAAAAGCSVPFGPVEGDADPGSSTAAVVAISRSSGPGAFHRSEASARFVRYRLGATVDEALSAVGADVLLPPQGSCAPLPRPVARPMGMVQLVDVGTVVIDADGQRTELRPRSVPEVSDLLSGHVYARALEPALLPARARYDIHVEGGDFPPMSSRAPSELAEVRIRGGAPDPDGAPVEVSAAVDLPVTWDAAGGGGSVYIDVIGSNWSEPRVRCHVRDEGVALIPAEVVRSAAEGVLSVHRLVRDNSGPAEVRFNFATVVPFKVVADAQ